MATVSCSDEQLNSDEVPLNIKTLPMVWTKSSCAHICDGYSRQYFMHNAQTVSNIGPNLDCS